MMRNRTLAMTALMIVVGATTAAARAPQQPTGDLPDGILYLEPVAMMSSVGAATEAANGGGSQTVQLSFHTLGRQFDLALEPSSPFAPGATVRWVSDTGVVEEPVRSGPYFRGRVEGDPNSWVRI